MISKFEQNVLKKVLLKDRPELKEDIKAGLDINFETFGNYYEDSPDQAIYDSIQITIKEILKIISKEPDEDEESIIEFKKVLKQKIKNYAKEDKGVKNEK